MEHGGGDSTREGTRYNEWVGGPEGARFMLRMRCSNLILVYFTPYDDQSTSKHPLLCHPQQGPINYSLLFHFSLKKVPAMLNVASASWTLSAPQTRPQNMGGENRVHKARKAAKSASPFHFHSLCTTKRGGGMMTLATSSSTPGTPPEQQQRIAADPFATKEQYSDADPLSKFMIRYFSRVMSKQLGGKPYDGTYDGFVELSREIMRGRSTKEQQETVASVLSGLLPPQSPERFRKWFPLNRRNAEFNAWITTLGFTWLVGPSELTDVQVEFQGNQETWRSGVHIKKCRYLENSGCVGMCTNMCKIPTQRFFTDMFGLPLTMNPNFETLECDMIFGQAPKPLEEDEVYNQPCLRVCNISSKTAASSERPCPKIDTERSIM